MIKQNGRVNNSVCIRHTIVLGWVFWDRLMIPSLLAQRMQNRSISPENVITELLF